MSPPTATAEGVAPSSPTKHKSSKKRKSSSKKGDDSSKRAKRSGEGGEEEGRANAREICGSGDDCSDAADDNFAGPPPPRETSVSFDFISDN